MLFCVLHREFLLLLRSPLLGEWVLQTLQAANVDIFEYNHVSTSAKYRGERLR